MNGNVPLWMWIVWFVIVTVICVSAVDGGYKAVKYFARKIAVWIGNKIADLLGGSPRW